MPEELWKEVHDSVQEAGIKTILKKEKGKKANWLSEEAIQIAENRREDGDCSHEIKRHFLPWNKRYDQPKQQIKNQKQYFANKGPSSQSYGFSSSHVQMWELAHKESCVLKKWGFWTLVLEKTL